MKFVKFPIFGALASFFMLTGVQAQQQLVPYDTDPFRQLDEVFPTADELRTASGAPGPKYWQQRADYRIQVRLDDEKRRIEGSETITYHNRSPHELPYLWLQLDQNRFETGSDSVMTAEAPAMESMSYKQLAYMLEVEKFDGGFKLKTVTDKDGKDLKYQVVKTMMRIDLATPLKSGQKLEFKIEWEHNIVDAKKVRARGGFEYFKKDGNSIYEMAQWYPRMAAYTDVNGWQHKQFLGRGEFTLEFGDFHVEITAPNDHIVAATGELKNANKVLTEAQLKRLEEAKLVTKPMFIVTPEEAKVNEKSKPTGEKTWVFDAENVRDFAWASSRKFAWDAVLHTFGQNKDKPKRAWAMSYYPNEAEPLWSKYSTQSVMHTLDVYSKYTFDYPYPVAISVNGPVFGMEYPMICFNGPRPEEDGTYSERTKKALIGVVIHEVGHNWFPMVVNSDERQWTWMDEGLNSFVEFLAEEEWESTFDGGGRPRAMTGYMARPDKVAIMTNSESIIHFGENAYSKPTAALNVLRESVMGRELFDFAFQEYSKRWMFKRPTPSDFFRSMEDASGIDLDWFWAGWFYTTRHVDVSIAGVSEWNIDSRNPDVEKSKKREKKDEEPKDRIETGNKEITKRIDVIPELKDFYNAYDPLDVTDAEREEYTKLLKEMKGDEKKLINTQRKFYVVDFENKGGLVMPLLVEFHYDNGKTEMVELPAEIWKQNGKRVSKLFMTKHAIEKIVLDPGRDTADANTRDNVWPPEPTKKSFRLIEDKWDKKTENPMQKAKKAVEDAEKKRKEEAEKEAEEKKKKEAEAK
jgi:hypothetical protein